MNTKDIILQLRTKQGLSQEELAEKLYVSRQAVSRWETGETTPNVDTLKLLSQLFDVSIDTLLGSSRQWTCRCCGIPLEDEVVSKEANGSVNKEYCKWCYTDGEFTMDYWKRYASLGGAEKFDEFKEQLISEINALQVEGMPKVQKLNVLSGAYVNLEYRLPNGQNVKFLNDRESYLGNQLECEFGGERCFGIVSNMDFILICSYEENGTNPELILYKKR